MTRAAWESPPDSAFSGPALKIAWACDRRYLLTGTPAVNCPRDLVALINMLGKLNSVFGGWRAFVERYCDGHQTDWCFDTSGATNLDELHEILYREKIMLRRMQHEVLALPKNPEVSPALRLIRTISPNMRRPSNPWPPKSQ